MNNQVKNNIEYEYMPLEDTPDNDRGIIILFKHDYYASNTSHGKELLSNIIYSLNSSDTKITRLLFVDSAVSLLNVDSIYASEISTLVDKSLSVFVCSESLEEYRADLIDNNNIIVADAELFFEQLFNSKPDIIIE